MKIRIMGTMAECEAARAFYASLEPRLKSLTISRLYPNRGSKKREGENREGDQQERARKTE